MTEITSSLTATRARRSRFSAPRRESWRIARARLALAGRPGDLEASIQPDPLSGCWAWTRGGEERVDGVRYPLALHGFARFETFAVETSGPDFARLTLSDNAGARAVYPVAFRALDVRVPAER